MKLTKKQEAGLAGEVTLLETHLSLTSHRSCMKGQIRAVTF